MTTTHHPEPGATPDDPRGFRDRAVRRSRDLTSTMLALTAALVVGLSGLAAASAATPAGPHGAAGLTRSGHVSAPASSSSPAPAVTSGAS